MYNLCMGMKKIIKEIERYADKAHSNGYDEGTFDVAEHYNEGYREGYNKGNTDERERVQRVLHIMSEQEMQSGSGTKAKMYRDVAELLALIYDHVNVGEELSLEDF